MNRHQALVTSLMVAVLSAGSFVEHVRAADRPAQPPNVLFILADDLGWGDLGCYGHRLLRTPNLDRMARQGTLFTHFYVNGSVCSPSRAAFTTSHFPARHAVHGHFATHASNAERAMPNFLDPKVHTVARLLKQAGYATGHIGKWHLSTMHTDREASGEPRIEDYGFGFVGSGETGGADGPASDPYYRANSSKLFVDQAIEFLHKNQERPFYLQFWTLVPHATLNPTDEQMEPYAGIGAGPQGFRHKTAAQIFYSSVTDLDKQIGRLLDALDRLGLTEKTLVIFSSDNGPEDIHIRNAGHSGVGSAGPFRGRKRSLYEGGVRVPFIVRWPGHVPADKVNDETVVAAVDFLPTVCNLAGADLPVDLKPDGEDMSDVLLGATRARETPLMWEWRFRIMGEPFHQSPMLAIREGNWKLYLNPDRSRVELYDMSTDHTQLNNVADEHPEVVSRLSEKVLSWQKELPAGPVEPAAGRDDYPWPGQAARNVRGGKAK